MSFFSPRPSHHDTPHQDTGPPHRCCFNSGGPVTRRHVASFFLMLFLLVGFGERAILVLVLNQCVVSLSLR